MAAHVQTGRRRGAAELCSGRPG